jgi:ribose transport system substrate-binding protein
MKRLLHQCIGFGFILLYLASGVASLAAPKIGVLLKGRSAFWTEAEKGARAAAEKAGVEILVKAPLTEDSVATQIQLLNSMATQGIEALVIVPTNENALEQPVAALAAKGIKIVVLDSPLAGKKWPFVGTDQYAAGEAAGHLLATFVQNSDEVAFFKASETQSGGATEERENGALSALRKSRPGIVVRGNIYAGSDPEIALERAGVMLDKYPAVKVVFASSSAGTMAMLHKLEQKKLAGSIKLVGFGFNLNPEIADALENGSLHGWVAQLPRDAAYKAVEAANTLLQGGSVPPVVNTDFFVITKDNLKEPKIQALLAQ